ncbi:hypothetical protein D3C81_1836960 [compost metagenome]
MTSMMCDLDHPAIDDGYVSMLKVDPNVGRNVVTISDDRQSVGPVEEQPGLIVRLRTGPDESPMLSRNLKTVTVGARDDGFAPAFCKTWNIGDLVNHTIA